MGTWQHWLNAILGIWVVVIPFLALTGGALTWTLVITGAVILVLGFWGAMEAQGQQGVHA
ncbi:MAG: SPW repeat domain-containing protein [Minisyncoccia bacterium]